jgi:chemotaxis protein methyltransferase CheR
MDDSQFKTLLDWWNFSWAGYRKVRKGVKKRISRHMQALACADMESYLTMLAKHVEVRAECEKRMTVSISRFFRDKKLWQDLEQKILPDLVEKEKKTIKVWSAGCARGEETYSFKIVWESMKAVYDTLPGLKITATDMNPDYIEMARSGRYSISSLKEVSPEILDHYFEKKKSGRRFEIKPFVKAGIDWRVEHLAHGPYDEIFHLIFLRNNVLTYYQDPLKRQIILKVLTSLKSGGWLIVGSHEKIPAGRHDLIRHETIPWAYNKKADC